MGERGLQEGIHRPSHSGLVRRRRSSLGHMDQRDRRAKISPSFRYQRINYNLMGNPFWIEISRIYWRRRFSAFCGRAERERLCWWRRRRRWWRWRRWSPVELVLFAWFWSRSRSIWILIDGRMRGAVLVPRLVAWWLW